MKTFVSLSVDLRPEKRERLAEIYPEGVRREYGFQVSLDRDDTRVRAILEMLHQMGYTSWSLERERDYTREYHLTLIREYEPSDFDGVDYVELFAPDVMDRIGDCERDEQSQLRLERPAIKNARRTGLDFASATRGPIVVLKRVRDLLLDGSFRHLVFQPTVLVTGRGLHEQRCTPIPWDQFRATEPWWELTSDLRLPPLAPSMELRDHKGNPFRPTDCRSACCAKEGFYNHAELHYRRSDLAKIEPFDVAQTFENFGSSHFQAYRTIVSKRFYDYCQQTRLKGRWAPVRVDET